jgi:predicted nucleotidyltransferase
MVDAGIIDSTRQYLRNLGEKGIPVSFAVLFGSQARGQAGKWSDIDLVVVSPKFDAGILRDDVNLLWRVAARTDSRIEPVPCGETQWESDTSSAIIEMARREGQRINPAA